MAIIKGSAWSNTLLGTADADIILGLGGNDTLKGMGGADRLDGGSGVDTVVYADSTVAVNINLATGFGSGGTAAGDTFIAIENVSPPATTTCSLAMTSPTTSTV